MQQSYEGEKLVKVAFRDDEGEIETLWAFDLGGNKYRLDSTPWFQYGVSFKDVIEALTEEDGMRFFSRILQKSGFRTVRVRHNTQVPQALLKSLTDIGCTYEGATPAFIAIDIPASVDLDRVVAMLTQSGEEWEHADPTYRDLYGNE